VVLVDGRPVIYVERGGRSMLIWSDDESVVQTAASALVETGRRQGLQIRLQRIDGVEVAASPRAPVLERAGLIRTPRGLRVPDARG
jgi:ATP-dependent Lhr-like helicase